LPCGHRQVIPLDSRACKVREDLLSAISEPQKRNGRYAALSLAILTALVSGAWGLRPVPPNDRKTLPSAWLVPAGSSRSRAGRGSRGRCGPRKRGPSGCARS
jgi:hypothetical protein